MTRARVFVSYCHKDQDLREEFESHLESVKSSAHCEFFVDKDGLVAGDDWHDKIQSALAKADIFLLLVSPNSLKSRYIQEHEIAPAFEAVKSGRLRFACLYLYTVHVPQEIRRFEGLNSPDEPIGKHEKDKQALASSLDAAVGKLRVLLHKPRKNPTDEQGYGERQELTVELARHGDTLQRSYFDATGFIDRSSYQWPKLARSLQPWLGGNAAAVKTASESGAFCTGLFDTLFLTDEGDCSARVLASIWGEQGHELDNPPRRAVRLRIHSEEPDLLGLPWRFTAWQGQTLCGTPSNWSFELRPKTPDKGGDDFDHETLTLPGGIALVIPDDQSEDTLAHYQRLSTLPDAVWAHRAHSLLPRITCRKEFDTQFETTPAIVYFYGRASASGDQLFLHLDNPKGGEERVELTNLTRAWRRCPVVWFLNVRSEDALDNATKAVAAKVPLLIVQRCFDADEADARERAIDWFYAVLRDLRLPAEAALETTLPATQIWTNYRVCECRFSEPTSPVRTELARIYLDRNEQRNAVHTAVVDLANDRDMRVTGTFAFGDEDNLVAAFAEQLFKSTGPRIQRQVVPYIRGVELPAQQDFGVDDLEQSLYRSLNAQPGNLKAALEGIQLPTPSGRRPFLLLHWRPLPETGSQRFDSKHLVNWERFCRERLAPACPPKLRVLALLPWEVEHDCHDQVKTLLEDLHRENADDRFDLLILPPLGDVDEVHLREFLRRREVRCPRERWRDLPKLIRDDCSGIFARAVKLLEEGLDKGWPRLHERLAQRPSD